MPTPVLFIGLGSSGLKTLEHVQRFHYESFRVNKSDYVEYLFLETDRSHAIGVTTLDNEIVDTYLSLDKMPTMIKDLKASTKAPWLPPEKQIIDEGMGAGGIRPCGRLSLWGRNNHQDNFLEVTKKIKSGYQRLSRNYPNDPPVIYITGTLAGGTASGIFIDIAYLVREIIPNARYLFGLLLIPPRPDAIRGREVMYANTYGALKDLDDYNSRDSIYQENWPNGQTVSEKKSPFDYVQIISQDILNRAPLSSLDALYKLSGLYLFLNEIGMFDRRHSRLVDAVGNWQIGKYGTFGLAGIQYPKDQIQENSACEISVRLCERWIAPDHYIKNNDKHQIHPTTIKLEVRSKWDNILQNAFDSLNNLEGRRILNELEIHTSKIINKEINKPPDQYVINIFSSNSTDEYYALIQNSIKTSFDSLVDQIYDLINETLDQTESLHYIQILLNEISISISETLNYWKSSGLTAKPNKWEEILEKSAYSLFRNQYKLIFEHHEVLKDRMVVIFNKLKTHLLIPKLLELKELINDKDKPRYTSFDEKMLPNISMIKDYIEKIHNVIGENEYKSYSLKRRIDLINSDVNDSSIPILRVFTSGTFENDIQNSLACFNTKRNNKYPSKDDILGESSLWQYFFKNRDNLEREVYNDSIKTYQDELIKHNCISDYDVYSYVKNNTKKAIEMAKRSTDPYLSTSVDFIYSDGAYIPRFIIGQDDSQISDIIEQLKDENYNYYPNEPDNKCAINNLSNLMVFYSEKGGFLPLKHLSYVEQMKKVFETPPYYIEDETVTKELWQSYRKAYCPITQEKSGDD